MRFCPQTSVGFGSNPNPSLGEGRGSEAVSSSSCDHRKVPYGTKSCGQGCVAWEEATETGNSVSCWQCNSDQHTPPKGKFTMREQKQQRREKWAVAILEKAGSTTGCVAGPTGSSFPWLWLINTVLIFVHILYFCGKYIRNVFLFVSCWPVWLRLCCKRITNSSKSMQLIRETSSEELCR